MGYRPTVFAILTGAALALVGAAGTAAAQNAGAAPSGRERGPADAGERRGFSYGGSITGRMNLLGPSEDGPLRAPTLPVPLPELGGPSLESGRARGDADPLNGLTLPNLAPGRPAALPPGAVPTPAPVVKQALTLRAAFADPGARIPNGVKWRVFIDQPDANGEHLMVAESIDASPTFELDPGGYVVHAVYGLVSTARFVSIAADRAAEHTIVLPAGALRLTALVGDAQAPADRVSFTLTRDEGGMARTVAENVTSGTLLRVPAGRYHVVSAYGDANAVVEVDVEVGAGKMVDARVHQKAALVSLKLVDRPGGDNLPNASWTILTPGGDVIRESIGALPPIVLSEGDYTAIARHDGRMVEKGFAVRAGADAQVEIGLN